MQRRPVDYTAPEREIFRKFTIGHLVFLVALLLIVALNPRQEAPSSKPASTNDVPVSGP
jgi:hypothetical protein